MKNYLRGISVTMALLLCSGILTGCEPQKEGMMVGIVHTGGDYSFTKSDVLNEGAEQVLNMGSSAIRIAFGPGLQRRYPGIDNSAQSLVQLAQTPAFDKLFSKSFTVFLLQCRTYAERSGKLKEVRQEIAAFSAYLREKYSGTGKKFIIMPEGIDRRLARVKWPESVNRKDRLTAYYTAWTEAVAEGRHGVDAGDEETVFSAIEFSTVMIPTGSELTGLVDILPSLLPDLLSYRPLEISSKPEQLYPAMREIRHYAQTSGLFGENDIFIGAYRYNNQREGKPRKLKMALGIAARYHIPYIFVSTLYDSGHQEKALYPAGIEKRKAYGKGYSALIDVMGRKTPSYHVVREFIENQ